MWIQSREGCSTEGGGASVAIYKAGRAAQLKAEGLVWNTSYSTGASVNIQ